MMYPYIIFVPQDVTANSSLDFGPFRFNRLLLPQIVMNYQSQSPTGAARVWNGAYCNTRTINSPFLATFNRLKALPLRQTF